MPPEFAVFDYSIVGYLLGRTPVCDDAETEPLAKDDDDEEQDESEEHAPIDQSDVSPLVPVEKRQTTFCSSILSVDYTCSVIWYLILCVRMSSWFAWIQTWSETLNFDTKQMTEFQYIKVDCIL